jgi:hypothetical protein
MTDQNKSTEIVVKKSYDVQLLEFENSLLDLLEQHGLPTEDILVSVSERSRVFKNADLVVQLVDDHKKTKSVYISKFMAAAAAGLFDAALNYLWDETISELRLRVAAYDLSYFYDNAVNQEKRKGLKSAEDLIEINDSELIQGAKKIGLISDLGFKHLDYIRYMRNWASAAHPNQNKITGLQLIGWLETCIKEVISLPLSQVTVDIRKLLNNIKTNDISESEAREIGAFFLNLTQDQANNLASGFFGIYTQSDTSSLTRQNIHRLLPLLWDRVDETTRQQFGIKYGKFTADNAKQESKFARQFLDLVLAVPYIPDVLRAAEIQNALEELLTVHRNTDNFYNEPPFALQLQRLVGKLGNVPSQISNQYVVGLVEVFLTNGNGVAWRADTIYKSLIEQFDGRQAFIAILSFTNDTIASSLQFSLCREKYRELLKMMEVKISTPALKELLEEIQKFSGPLDSLRNDTRIKQKVNNITKILGINISL